MPLFMDRHFLSGATAEAVAEAHQLDIANAEKYGCQTMTYWFDEKSGIAFCLIAAPNKEAVEKLHKNTHGLIPNKIIQVDGDLVELFLGRVTDPDTGNKINEFEKAINESGFRAIMHIDFKYTSEIELQIGSTTQSEILKLRNKILRDAIRKYNGREVIEHTDGEFILSFDSIPNSINCAVEMQKNIFEHNNKDITSRINIGIGLCAGSPVNDSNNFFEESMQLAKRLFKITEANQIVVSSTIKDFFEDDQINLLKNKFLKTITLKEESFLNQLMDITESIWNDENFSVDNFCKQIGLSKSQLYRKIVSLIGSSPNEFIKEYRLDNSLKLIKKKNMNISEIAYESGFNDASYFSRCFQKRFGILPSNYSNILS